MKFLEMKIRTAAAETEMVTAVLMSKGINNIQVDDPAEIAEMIADPGDTEWYDLTQVPDRYADGRDEPEVTVTVYFDSGEEGSREAGEILDVLAERLGKDAFDAEVKERDDSEWKDNWKKYYTTTRVGQRVVVSPTWEDVTQEDMPEEIVIKMDPGMAFGTGTHETTSLAIRMLEKYVRPGDMVLDIGTGSGILSIAAARLGAGEALGVDIDSDAVRVAEENISANGVSDVARAICGDLAEGLDCEADLVVANLLADLVMRFAADAFRHTRPGGLFISSGILTEKQALVEESVRNAGFTIEEVMTDGEWCSIAALRPSAGR